MINLFLCFFFLALSSCALSETLYGLESFERTEYEYKNCRYAICEHLTSAFILCYLFIS